MGRWLVGMLKNGAREWNLPMSVKLFKCLKFKKITLAGKKRQNVKRKEKIERRRKKLMCCIKKKIIDSYDRDKKEKLAKEEHRSGRKIAATM